QLYRDARECLTLLSQRLGSQKFFFGDSYVTSSGLGPGSKGGEARGPTPSPSLPRPASLDALVFSRLAPLLKAKLPNGKLQQHLKSLHNLCNHCAAILSLYFPWDGGERAGGSDADDDPHKRRNQVLSVLAGLGAMLLYALLSGIVAVQRGERGAPARGAAALPDHDDDD
ncbi:MTX1 protein, partial [Eudromia elegans]|nr:MTX1 protein [Eudromia elegans]